MAQKEVLPPVWAEVVLENKGAALAVYKPFLCSVGTRLIMASFMVQPPGAAAHAFKPPPATGTTVIVAILEGRRAGGELTEL